MPQEGPKSMTPVEFMADLTGALRAHGASLRGRMVDLVDWGRTYFPAYFDYAMSKLHVWLAGKLQHLHERRGSGLWLIAPRGAAKSTWITFLYVIWCICHKTETYIVICADTAEQAQRYLAGIKSELESNLALRAAYPAACGEGPLWQKEAVVTANGIRVDALGTGKAIRGRREKSDRPSLIIVDDPEGEDSIFSTITRKRIRDWWERAVMKAGSPATNYLAAGTVLHRECLINRIAENPRFEGQRFRSIGAWPRRLDLWDAWEEILHDHRDPDKLAHAREFYLQNRHAMDDGAEVCWPEREPLYELMLQRASGRVAFENEKQNNPVDPTACEFPEDYFTDTATNRFWFDEDPEPELVTHSVLYCDPSKGAEASTGDYCAWVLIQRTTTGQILTRCWMFHGAPEQVAKEGLKIYQRFRPDTVGMEVNQFQELFMVIFQREAKDQAEPVPLTPVMNTIKKELRIRKLDPWLSQRLILFHRGTPGTRLLVEQLQDFPVGDYDDGPDALEGALRILQHYLQSDDQPTEYVPADEVPSSRPDGLDAMLAGGSSLDAFLGSSSALDQLL